MTTIRNAHRKQYVSISNKLAQNNALTLKARGLMLYLLSLPDDWKIHISHLESVMIEKRKGILAAFKELKMAGYVWHQKMGYKEGWTYWVFEDPTNEDQFKEFLRTKPLGNSSLKEQFPKEQLQKTNRETKDLPICTNDLPPPPLPTKVDLPYDPTKEEEEEVSKRLKERKAKTFLAKVGHEPSWKKKCLKEVRQENASRIALAAERIEKDLQRHKQAFEAKERRERHFKEAETWFGKTYKGWLVSDGGLGVWFAKDGKSGNILYDITDEEWRKLIKWK